MARVKCLTGLAGIRFSFKRGDEAEFDDDEAARFVAAGYAAYVGAPPIRESASPANKVADRPAGDRPSASPEAAKPTKAVKAAKPTKSKKS